MTEPRAFTTKARVAALLTISEIQKDCAKKLQQYIGMQRFEIRREPDTVHHVYNSLVKSSGRNALPDITNFSSHKIETTFDECHAF